MHFPFYSIKNIAGKIRLWVFFVLGIMLGVVAISFYNLSEIDREIEYVINRAQPRYVESLILSSLIYQASTDLERYLLSHADSDKDAYFKKFKLISQSINKLTAISSSSHDNKQLQTISLQLKQFSSIRELLFSLVENPIENYPALKLASEQLEPLAQTMLQQSSDMVLSVEDIEDEIAHNKLLSMTQDLRYNWSSVIGNVRYYLAFRNEVSLDQIELFTKGTEQVISAMADLTDDMTEEQFDVFDEFIASKTQYLQLMQTAIKLHQSVQWRRDSYLVRTQLSQILSQMDKELLAFIESQQTSIQRAELSLTAISKQSRNTLVLLMSIAMVTTMIGSTILIRSITRPILKAVQIADRVAQGDLSQRLNFITQDELGMLGRALDQSSENLSNLIHQIGANASMLSKTADSLTFRSKQLSEDVILQNESVDKTSAALAEISEVVDRNVALANQTAIISSQVAAQAEEGGKAVEQTLLAMQQIVKKIGAIEDISLQTNVLAINAAIEARRFGEKGEGFSVVAKEVRRLAGLSEQIAKEVSELANKSVSVGQQANTLIMEILPISRQADTLVQGIAISSEEQARRISEVNADVTQLREISIQHANLAQHIAKTSEELRDQEVTLQKMVNFFKLLS